MASGIAFTLSVRASPDGPVSGGASLLLTVQPVAMRTQANAIAARRMYVKGMTLKVPKVAELDPDLSHHGHIVANTIGAVKRHSRDDVDDVRTGLQLNQGGLELRGAPDQFEAKRDGATGRNGASERAVERVRHIDARRVAAVGADVLHVVAVDRDFIVRGRRERSGGADVLKRRPQ